MSKKRKSNDEPYEPSDPYELAMVGGVGSVTTLTETPKKRRTKVKRHRPIGYMADIDKLEDAE